MNEDLVVERRNVIRKEKGRSILILITAYTAIFLNGFTNLVILPLIPSYLRDFQPFQEAAPPETKGYQHDLTAIDNTEPAFIIQNLSLISNLTNYIHFGKVQNESSLKDSLIPRAGILFASKSFFQFLFGPIAGTILDKAVLRAVQGMGCALCVMAGFAILAKKFEEQSERSKYQGIASAIMSFGCNSAPIVGGFLYEYCGRSVPFLLLAIIASINSCITIYVLCSAEKQISEEPVEKSEKATPIYRLINDPYVAICAGVFFICGLTIGFLEPTIAQWMNDSLEADEFQSGLVWLPSTLFHIVGVVIIVYLIKRFPSYQWLYALLGLLIMGVGCFSIAFCKHFAMVIIPLTICVIGTSFIDTTIFPLLGRIVDKRHVAVYGSVYAIADMAYSLANATGPILGDFLYHLLGFMWLNAISCTLCVIYSPLLFIARKICVQETRYDKPCLPVA